MKDWLNEIYNTNFDSKQFDEILNFSLIWNIFEGKIFDSKFTLYKLNRIINESPLNINDFQTFLDYFQNRYTNKEGVNERFQHLNIRKQEHQELLTKTLLNQEENPYNQIFSLGIIAYRYRCNLFHGIKQFERLNQQIENFEVINDFLFTIIQKLKKH